MIYVISYKQKNGFPTFWGGRITTKYQAIQKADELVASARGTDVEVKKFVNMTEACQWKHEQQSQWFANRRAATIAA